MLLKPSHTFVIESHIHHGRSHDDGVDETQKCHSVRTLICTLLISVAVHTKNDVIIKVRCPCCVRNLDLYGYLAIIGVIWIDW